MVDIAVFSLLLWSAAIFYHDIRTHIIPNSLSLGAICIALFVLVITGQTLTQQPLMSAMLGFFVALALTLPGYVFKLLGGGDVKLLCAVGLLCGLGMMLLSFALASIGTVVIFFIWTKIWVLYRPQIVVVKP